ncbi:MAG: hypothetical protein MUQ43_12090 [Reinekea forsetii]|jgi:NAD(P)-dependent dehydrogenase (short-subunit alcohol dehydrogenase family)|nr:hypothetical protein [Reinekea forsetii]MDO7645040.1 hypothetical protein [Reinekea forsetii]MDO7675159.1 hypothetical protein [Reinekea forsetii]
MNKTNWTLDQAPSQAGKIALITGANVGLGYETALGLAQTLTQQDFFATEDSNTAVAQDV